MHRNLCCTGASPERFMLECTPQRICEKVILSSVDQCLILPYSDHRNSASISDFIRTIIGTMGVEESRFRRKLLRVSHGQKSKVSTDDSSR